MIDFTQFDSLIAMTMYFNNEATCRQAIIETRWGVGDEQDVICPYCGEQQPVACKVAHCHVSHFLLQEGCFLLSVGT